MFASWSFVYGNSYVAIGGVHVATLLIFRLLAHLPIIDRAYQCCNTDRTLRKSYLSAIGLEQSLFVCKLELFTPPTTFFSFAPAWV